MDMEKRLFSARNARRRGRSPCPALLCKISPRGSSWARRHPPEPREAPAPAGMGYLGLVIEQPNPVWLLPLELVALAGCALSLSAMRARQAFQALAGHA